jgi:8-oxo-dGTP pyrophosphatase MutT (NUDIX family)
MLTFDPSREPSVPIDAATVLLVRPAETWGIELLLVRRHASTPFLGGAVVFPGGKLDVADHAATAHLGFASRALDVPGFAVARAHLVALGVCACRESLEEAGVFLASPAPTVAAVARVRAALAAGVSLDDGLSREGVPLRLDLDRLEPFARWVTPKAEPRRFGARFFLARAPEGQTGEVDHHETVAAMWSAPRPMLQAFHRRDVFLAPPTLRALELLADVGDVDEAFAVARRQSLQPIEPRFVEGDPAMLILPGDPLHEVDEPRVDGGTRFVLRDGRLVSEHASR